ncbi:NERD domain-containing protein [Dolichospermum sp. ST_con]|nr:NERD domain-containing protein [Dolichospermum sp. ST_con]MDD1422517.1 NERD domain-containing protein [Dolichospermum sp. ST_sed1]MDD1427980.1 NERD domain-containing protein [Dolichospermum sp. ST_sed9]MDD1437104.1 NERD domain-containing protein [Dolichospermum sp. ST_sed10]
MTSGERRFAERILQHLSDEWLAWYNVPVGIKNLHPDFILLHPSRGLFILEVKDWKLSTIKSINPLIATIITENGEKEVKNPFEQSRDYALAVSKLLEQDSELIQQNGNYRGRLIIPYSYGVVFANITRSVFNQQDLKAVCKEKEHLIICKNEMFESTPKDEFQQRIFDLSAYNFGNRINRSQVDRIRWHLFPEIQICGNQLSLFNINNNNQESSEMQIPDVIRVMDLEQEELARNLKEGHRVIHGVAGSGKTMILAFRCQTLAQIGNKPILVLCFNVSLAAKLRHMIREKKLNNCIIVQHFHGWCKNQLVENRIGLPNINDYQTVEAYLDEMVQRVINSVNNKNIPSGIYNAIMIDEGHDFKPEWFKLMTQMVDPMTNSLLILYDDAQNLYNHNRRSGLGFTWSSIGIQAVGRTKILKLNYRNTEQILWVAYEFAKEVMISSNMQDEDKTVLLEPVSAKRQGEIPEIIYLTSFQNEKDYLVERVQELYSQGIPWNEIAIIYRSRNIGEIIYDKFLNEQIPIEWVNATDYSRNYRPASPKVKLITMHSSKGLEFPVVFIPCISSIGQYGNEILEEEEVRLIYVAMTRAIDHLIMTCNRVTLITERIKLAVEKAALRTSGKFDSEV